MSALCLGLNAATAAGFQQSACHEKPHLVRCLSLSPPPSAVKTDSRGWNTVRTHPSLSVQPEILEHILSQVSCTGCRSISNCFTLAFLFTAALDAVAFLIKLLNGIHRCSISSVLQFPYLLTNVTVNYGLLASRMRPSGQDTVS